MHDTQNEAVRAGLMSLRMHELPEVVFSDLAFVQLFQDPRSPSPRRGEGWAWWSSTATGPPG